MLRLAAIFLFALQWWTGRKLSTQFGNNARPRLFNRYAVIGVVLIIAVHYLILALQPNPPMWYLLQRMSVEVWLMNLTK